MLVSRFLKNTFLLTGIMAGMWAFTSDLFKGLLGFVDLTNQTPDQAVSGLPGLVGASLCVVLVLIWITSRTALSGARFWVFLFIAQFGVMFFMTQIETLFFNDAIDMPILIVAAVVTSGFMTSALLAYMFTRLRRKLPSILAANRPDLTPQRMIGSFAAAAVLYTVFYFFFGYFTAWQSAALREFYTASDEIQPFATHMIGVFQSDLTLVGFQLIRGLLWAGLGFLIATNLHRAARWEVPVITGMALSVPLAAPLMVTNDFMPPEIRFAHFFELLIENFLFGVFVALIFRPTWATSTQKS